MIQTQTIIEEEERALRRCTDEEIEITASVLSRFLHDRSIQRGRSGLKRADYLKSDWWRWLSNDELGTAVTAIMELKARKIA